MGTNIFLERGSRFMKKIVIILIIALFCVVQFTWAESSKPRVQLETNYGIIILELDPKSAPKTVENFLYYANNGFYVNTVFHRVIKGFMIQGGGLTADMEKKPTQSQIRNEADNGLKNKRGTVAMARTLNPHSASSQFFINTADNAFLDYKGKTANGWGYCVFGRVVEGMDVVDTIEGVTTTMRAGHKDVPTSPVTIKQAMVEK
jgi:peptidyl-prolyl cis-trans isomerase B (cyclophilin B)